MVTGEVQASGPVMTDDKSQLLYKVFLIQVGTRLEIIFLSPLIDSEVLRRRVCRAELAVCTGDPLI